MENTDVCWEETEDWLINKGTPVYEPAGSRAARPTHNSESDLYNVRNLNDECKLYWSYGDTE